MTKTQSPNEKGKDALYFDELKIIRTRIIISYLLFAWFIAASTSCSPIPTSDFYEVDGLISGEIADTTDTPGWESIQFINSKGLKYTTSDTSGRNPHTFTVYISNPGNYSFWLLAANPATGDSTTKVDILATSPDGFLIARAAAEIPQRYSLQWGRAATSTESNFLLFDKPGKYLFSLAPRGSGNIQIHKFQMSLRNAEQPFGVGLPSSIRTDLSAADLFREIPLMLPPSWVFKPIFGFDGKRFQDSDVDFLRDETIALEGAGAIWAETDAGLQSGFKTQTSGEIDLVTGVKHDVDEICEGGAKFLFESGNQFIFAQHKSPGLACLRRLHREYQQVRGEDLRSVLFHGIENAWNTEIKQFPAPVTPNYTFEWSEMPLLQNGGYSPGGFRELVGDLSNPAGSLYNMPFLSMPVNYSTAVPNGPDWDSELFNKTIQLSPFLPVMHITLPDRFDLLSESEKRQLQDAVVLRNSLFPYSYSHAHYTRQSNESIISGFRKYPYQFLYGDAFLVAPITEPGNRGRLVYFPEGRRWYNYHSGESFDAGRSWFVETESNQLPLFVKAGSVIPYKLKDDPNHLTIEIYTGDAGAFRLVEDDGRTRAYRRAQAARTMLRYNEIEGNLKLTIGAVQAGFNGMSDRRSYNIIFKHAELPERIEIDGKELVWSSDSWNGNSWYYDESKESVILKLSNKLRSEKIDIVIYP